MFQSTTDVNRAYQISRSQLAWERCTQPYGVVAEGTGRLNEHFDGGFYKFYDRDQRSTTKAEALQRAQRNMLMGAH